MRQEPDIITPPGVWVVPVRREKGCTKLWRYHGFSRKHFLQNIPAECRAFNDDTIAAAKPYDTKTRL